jgi:pimeloyl-ACP methyl ester carboxylesterase
MASRSPLVLIPGLLNDANLWSAQIGGLADIAAMQVADHTRFDTMEAIARSILATAPVRFALAGLSMGGYICFAIMRLAPQRVLRLALLNTSARADTPERTAERRQQIALVAKGRFLGISDALLPRFVHPDRLTDFRRTEQIKGMAQAIGPDAFIRQQTAIMCRSDSRPLLPQIRCPTLVLCGRQDAPTPVALHEEMANAIPHARLAIIEDCGHLSPMERPDAVNAELRRWLSDRTP